VLLPLVALAVGFGCSEYGPEEQLSDEGVLESSLRGSGSVGGSSRALDVSSYFARHHDWRLSYVRFGEFHSHSLYSADAATCGAVPGQETYDPTGAYEYADDVEDLDFVGLSDHAEYPNPIARPREHRRQRLNLWQSETLLGMDANDESVRDGDDAFIVFADWEYTNTPGFDNCHSDAGYGHKNVIFRDLSPDLLPEQRYAACNTRADYLAPDAWALWEALDEYRPSCPRCVGDAMTIVHTPAMVGDVENPDNAQNHSTDWDAMDGDFVRHVELMSKWGNSEGHAPEAAGCSDPDTPLEHPTGDIDDTIAIRSILYGRWIDDGNPDFVLGFVGGTDNHQGRPGNDIAGMCGMQYRGGITGIVSRPLTREGLWTSLWDRSTIALTADSRIRLLVAAETGGRHITMGEVGPHDGTVRVRALASDEVSELHLIVDGCLDRVIDGRVLDETIDFDDTDRHFVYVRAVEVRSPDDERQAWSSPIYLGEPEE